MATPICYVSGGLGATPSTPLESTHGIVNWNLYDRRVRMVPDADAVSILSHNPQDFAECVFIEEGYGGFGPAELSKLGESGAVHVETYYPKAGDEPVKVLVLDGPTLGYLADLTARAATLREKGEVDTSGLATKPPKPPKKGGEK